MESHLLQTDPCLCTSIAFVLNFGGSLTNPHNKLTKRDFSSVEFPHISSLYIDFQFFKAAIFCISDYLSKQRHITLGCLRKILDGVSNSDHHFAFGHITWSFVVITRPQMKAFCFFTTVEAFLNGFEGAAF